MSPTASFTALLRDTGVHKRAPALVGGKRGEPVIIDDEFACTNVFPLEPAIAATLEIEEPHTLQMIYVDAVQNILKGDELVISGKTYFVRAVGNWLHPHVGDFQEVILEDPTR